MFVLRVSHDALENPASTNRVLSPSLSSRRRELGILTEPPEQLLKPTTEEMYSHLQVDHPESLEMAERDWKAELFGVGPLANQQTQ